MPSIDRHALMGILIAIFLAFLAASCMTDREYQLRRADIRAKAAHAPTYQPLVLQGPLSLEDGASLAVTVPSEPYQNTPIPDGAATQERVIGNLTQAAGIVGLGAMGIYKAGDKHITTTAPQTETPAP